MPKAGIEKLYVAKNITDLASGMTFTPPVYFKNVQELDIKPKYNTDSAYAENRMVDQATDFESADITASRYSMLNSERAFLFGQALASTSGSVSASGDEPPLVALLYKAPIRVDKKTYYRYGVIYEVMFTPPDDTFKGLEGKPDLSASDKITGTAQSTEWSFYDANGKEKHPWEYHIDTCDPNCPADIEDTWFTAVAVPSLTAISALTLSSSAPIDAATAVALTTKPVLTFNNAISNYSNIILLDETDDTIVAKTMSLDVTGKILTISPTASLVTAKTYDIILIGVTDAYGQVLAQQINKFTTV